MSTTHTDHCIDVCNKLYRGEISAIETYTQAIDKFKGEAEHSTLADIRREHIFSADRLRHSIRDMGGEPTTDSGAWGMWAKAVEGAAKLMGDTPALKALLEGEEHGRNEYEEALGDDEVLSNCKEMIRNELLPRQVRHISILKGLMRAR